MKEKQLDIARFKEFMYSATLKQVELAKLLNITPAHSSKICNGTSPLNERYVYILNQKYPNLNIDYLFGGAGPMWLPETMEELPPEVAKKLKDNAENEVKRYISELRAKGADSETIDALLILLGRIQNI